ncbi:hypothetical protein ACQKP1_11070 [Allorhizobium sp. NPDC080224]|jgi:hypothetical protein|uniref:hypothetical protein n=1 Tax=Allorhizobium sp. NPDC080224 TaxID=3390547 RepID=UPI00086AE5C2|nr:MAG: hypothetical protein ABS40_18710 [Agrobacterium sp. SCN 61-19]
MPSLSRLLLSAIAALAIFGLLLLNGSGYDWMAELDPGIEPSTIETDGNRALVRNLLLTTALGASALMAIGAKTRGARILPLVLSVLALAAYVFSAA